MKTNKYQTIDKTQIVKGLRAWLKEQTNAIFFTTCYKARAIGVFVQYEIPDRISDPYLYASDQGTDEVMTYVAGWLNAIFQKDVVFKIEEREKIGFSIFITMEKKEDIQGDMEITEDDLELPKSVQVDPVLQESETRSIEEIVVVATSKPISRSMESVAEEVIEGIKRTKLPSIKVQPNVRVNDIDRKELKEEKQVGRKSEYNWDKLSELFKKHNGSVTKIAKELGCSGPAVRRQITKHNLK